MIIWSIKKYGLTKDNGFSIWVGQFMNKFHIRFRYSKNHKNNRKLYNFCVSYKSSQFVLYLVKYNENGSLPWHVDHDKKCNIMIIELKKAELGGDLEFENNNFKKIGRFYFFRGDLVKHRVTEIIKGSRWILMTQIA